MIMPRPIWGGRTWMEGSSVPARRPFRPTFPWRTSGSGATNKASRATPFNSSTRCHWRWPPARTPTLTASRRSSLEATRASAEYMSGDRSHSGPKVPSDPPAQGCHGRGIAEEPPRPLPSSGGISGSWQQILRRFGRDRHASDHELHLRNRAPVPGVADAPPVTPPLWCLRDRLAREHPLAGQHLKKYHAEGPDVGPLVYSS